MLISLPLGLPTLGLHVNPLDVVTSAVTPAVMISASAILIGGISTKHTAMSDRLRDLTNTCRSPETDDSRRANVLQQVHLYMIRIRYVERAHILLYFATAAFVAMIFAISMLGVFPTAQATVFPFFLVGVTALLISVVFEIAELRMAHQTLLLEIGDVLPPAELAAPAPSMRHRGR